MLSRATTIFVLANSVPSGDIVVSSGGIWIFALEDVVSTTTSGNSVEGVEGVLGDVVGTGGI